MKNTLHFVFSILLFTVAPLFPHSLELNSGVNFVLKNTHQPGIFGEALLGLGSEKAEFSSGVAVTQVKGVTKRGSYYTCTYDDNHFFRVFAGFTGIMEKNLYCGLRANADFEFDQDRSLSISTVLGKRVPIANSMEYFNIAVSIGHGFYYYHRQDMEEGYPKVRIIIGLGAILDIHP